MLPSVEIRNIGNRKITERPSIAIIEVFGVENQSEAIEPVIPTTVPKILKATDSFCPASALRLNSEPGTPLIAWRTMAVMTRSCVTTTPTCGKPNGKMSSAGRFEREMNRRVCAKGTQTIAHCRQGVGPRTAITRLGIQAEFRLRRKS